MSRDIFVQDLPPHAATTADIPDDFEPQPIGPAKRIIEAIQHLAPAADFSDPTWGRIDGPGYSIEVNLPEGDDIDAFALHVRGEGADPFIHRLLTELNLRGLDSEAEDGAILPRTQALN